METEKLQRESVFLGVRVGILLEFLALVSIVVRIVRCVAPLFVQIYVLFPFSFLKIFHKNLVCLFSVWCGLVMRLIS